MADIGTEPSMEDILSSIKRIIAEDSEAALAAPRTRRSVAAAPPPPAPASDGSAEGDGCEEDDVLELTDAVAVDPVPAEAVDATAATAEEEHQVPRTTEAAPAARPAIAAPETVEASRARLAALSALVVRPEVAGSDTLEGLVRDMLKPMLAEWLDANLPDVVERLVAQEISRIVTRP